MDAKTLCLGILAMQDASGYEIRKICEEGPFAFFHQIGFGSIYPALNKIQEQGLATCCAESQVGRPDKKVYSLTDEGLGAFFEILTSDPAPDKMRSEMLFLLFFGDKLPDDRCQQLLDGYRRFYEDRISVLKSKDVDSEGAGLRFVHGFGLALYQAALQYLNENGDDFVADGKNQNSRFDLLNLSKSGAAS